MTRGLTAMLGSYPEWVVRGVCDPRSGLPATSKFFPTLYEVRSACEARIRPVVEADARRRREEEAAADRPAPVSEADGERRKAFIAKWREDLAVMEAEQRTGIRLEDLDARKCQGEVKEKVMAALGEKLDRLKAESIATPLCLSPAALRACGISVPVESPPDASVGGW